MVLTLLLLLPLNAYALFYSSDRAEQIVSFQCFQQDDEVCRDREYRSESFYKQHLVDEEFKCHSFLECRGDVSFDLTESDSLSFKRWESFIDISDYDSDRYAKKEIEKQITFFSRKSPYGFKKWLENASKYQFLMRRILMENELPDDLIFLPLIESGYNLNAYSRSHAVGPWQFMRSTARKFGLTINYWVDERRDPLKSTYAASKYLKSLYERFGSWDLALAAYNAGEGKIGRAIRQTRSKNFWKISKTPYIKRETKKFVPRFLAAREIAREPRKFGLEGIDYRSSMDFDVVTIKPPVDIHFIAKYAGTTTKKIKELNPELKRWCLPPNVKEYTLRLPPGKRDIFLNNFNKTLGKSRFTLNTYRIKKGDTLNKIAKREGVSLKLLYELNKIKNPRRIRVGSLLYLPPARKYKEKSSIKRRVSSKPGTIMKARIASKPKTSTERKISNKSRIATKKKNMPVKTRVPVKKS